MSTNNDETGELKARVRRLENIVLNKLAGDDGEGDMPEDSDVVENPFGFNFGRGKKPAQDGRTYFVTFESAAGDVRELTVKADNKKEALAKAKQWMREDGEVVRGASWEVEAAE